MPKIVHSIPIRETTEVRELRSALALAVHQADSPEVM